jgi:hypothetical protein
MTSDERMLAGISGNGCGSAGTGSAAYCTKVQYFFGAFGCQTCEVPGGANPALYERNRDCSHTTRQSHRLMPRDGPLSAQAIPSVHRGKYGRMVRREQGGII